MYKSHNIMSLPRDMKLMLRDKSVDLKKFYHVTRHYGCLGHNLLSLRQVSSMSRHKPDLLLFGSIAVIDDLLSKHALGIL